MDAIIHVVRCFENDDIIHVYGSINPSRDIETVNLELIFADLEVLDRRIDRGVKAMKGDKALAKEVDFLKRLRSELERGVCARHVDTDDDEKAVMSELSLLTSKPVIYACNMSEEDFAGGIETNPGYAAVKEIAAAEGAEVLPICAELEAQIVSLEPEEKELFLSELGIENGGFDLLIRRSYSLWG